MRLRPLLRTARKRVDVDLFAGGGGAGEGKRRATGKSADVAVNHWPAALSMYAANHPTSRLLIADLRNVEPLEATLGRLVRLLWASPTCAWFSRASGRRLSPEAVKIRALADVVLPWIDDTEPEVLIVENVIEFLGWGPAYDRHDEGCPGAHDESGELCAASCRYGRPIPELKGSLFAAWRAAIEARGYSFEYRILKAWEYGAPTTRERLYVVCCRDRRPFSWPAPSHARPEDVERTGLQLWRTAAEIIDWSIPCPSIFERATPHVPATRRRIAKGMRKFVLESAQPFLLHLTHGDRHAPHSIEVPVPTVTGANRGEQALAVPFMIHRSNGEREGQEPRTYDIQRPHPTTVAGGIKTAPVVAFLAKAYSERETGGFNGGSALDKPTGAVTAQDHHHLVAVCTTKFYGTSTGQQVNTPLHAVTGGGWKHGVVAASLAATEWNDIIAAKARRVYRFLVEEGIDGPWLDHANQLVRLPGTELVIWDVGMRMLVPRELFRANGFSESYIIDLIGPRGKPLTKTEQVRLVGNSVCPHVAEALCRAALARPSRQLELRMEAA